MANSSTQSTLSDDDFVDVGLSSQDDWEMISNHEADSDWTSISAKDCNSPSKRKNRKKKRIGTCKSPPKNKNVEAIITRFKGSVNESDIYEETFDSSAIGVVVFGATMMLTITILGVFLFIRRKAFDADMDVGSLVFSYGTKNDKAPSSMVKMVPHTEFEDFNHTCSLTQFPILPYCPVKYAKLQPQTYAPKFSPMFPMPRELDFGGFSILPHPDTAMFSYHVPNKVTNMERPIVQHVAILSPTVDIAWPRPDLMTTQTKLTPHTITLDTSPLWALNGGKNANSIMEYAKSIHENDSICLPTWNTKTTDRSSSVILYNAMYDQSTLCMSNESNSWEKESMWSNTSDDIELFRTFSNAAYVTKHLYNIESSDSETWLHKALTLRLDDTDYSTKLMHDVNLFNGHFSLNATKIA